jgi:predicted MFS family arabinose efflux permease
MNNDVGATSLQTRMSPAVLSQIEAPPGKSSFVAYIALALLFTLYVLNWTHRQIISMFLESMRRDLGLSDTQIGIFGGIAFTLFYAAAALPIASLADRRSRPIILSVCVALWSACLSLSGLAVNFVQLILARALLGVGEAGFGPTANALLASYFPPPRLARAAAIFGAGSSVGILVAYGAGGWLLTEVGWRKGLILAGLPGLVLSVIVLLVLKETRAAHTLKAAQHTVTISRGVLAFLTSRTLVLFIGATVLATMCDANIFVWYAPFMVRTHHIRVGELGWVMGVLLGLGQMCGILVGGFVSEHLSKRDARWLTWIPSMCCLAAILPAGVIYLTSSQQIATFLIAAPIFLSVVYWAPMIVCLQLLAPEGLLATFIAMAYLVINGIGYGVGPLIVGSLSDLLHLHFHDESLRYAMLSTLPIYAAAALGYYGASYFIRSELGRKNVSERT